MTGEPTDDALERELQRRFAEPVHSVDDTDAVLTAMRPRLVRARWNRRAVSASVAVLGGALALVVGLAAFSAADHDRRVDVPPAAHAPVTPTTTRVPGGTETPAPPGAPDAGDTPADNGTVPTAPSSPVDNGASAGGGAAAAPETTVPTTAPPAGDATYSSPGGSIVVRRSGDVISLASSSPASGFTQELHDDGPTRVEVRFTSDGTEWRIRVDLTNGQLVAETTRHG
jgi:hypothetical protein